MLKNVQSIAQENHYQFVDSPETDPAQYISDDPGMELLSKQYRVDVSYLKTCLVHSRLTQRIHPRISSLRNQVQVHLRSTLMLSVMVSGLTPHACSIERPISTCCNSLLPDDPASRMPLNCVYPLCITLDRFILLHSKHIFFLRKCFESVAASTHRVSSLRH